VSFAVEFSSDLTLALTITCKRSVQYIICRHNERNCVILNYIDLSNSCYILHMWVTEFDLLCNVATCLSKFNVCHAATRLFSARRKEHSSSNWLIPAVSSNGHPFREFPPPPKALLRLHLGVIRASYCCTGPEKVLTRPLGRFPTAQVSLPSHFAH
jgi:hypothetical protein